ncbi:MAG: hypothetical protein PHV05_02695, partial [Candidatus Riflebacteria bacterium]|nr:hypothetical protein [Candidatus Riflebacteria bacterium]
IFLGKTSTKVGEKIAQWGHRQCANPSPGSGFLIAIYLYVLRVKKSSFFNSFCEFGVFLFQKNISSFFVRPELGNFKN